MANNDLTSKLTALKKKSLILSNALGDMVEQSSWYYIFPFRIHTGLTNYTIFGFTDNNVSPEEYLSFERLVSGDELIIATWRGATEIATPLKEDGTPDLDSNHLIRTFHKEKAHFWKGYITENNSQVQFDNSAFGDGSGNFVTIQTARTVTLQVRQRLTNEQLLRINRNELYDLYLIPQYTNEGESTLGSELEWMYISSADLFEDIDSHETYTNVTFTSLNDKLSGSGRSINTFVTAQQAVGDGMVLPKVLYDENGKAIDFEIDGTSLIARGVDTIQFSTMGPALVSNFKIVGRPKLYKNFVETEIFAPRRLFPYKFKQPVPSRINAKSSATSSFLLTHAVNEIAGSYENWYQRRDSNKTPSVVKKYDGYLRTNYNETIATNTENFFISDDNWAVQLGMTGILNKEIDVKGSVGFNYILTDEESGDTTYIGKQFINLNDMTERKIQNIMTILSIAYDWIVELPMTISQTVGWTLKEIPFIGGFATKLTLGLIPAWNQQTNHTNINYPKFNGVYGIIAPDYYDWYNNTFWNMENTAGDNTGLLPHDMFSVNQESKVGGILDATSQSTAITFELTDKVMLFELNLKTGALATTPTACSSLAIGKVINDADGKPDKMYIITENTVPLSPLYKNHDGTNVLFNDGIGGNNYLLDYIGIQAITDSNIEISCYTNDIYKYDPQQISIFNSVIKSESAYIGQHRAWTSGIKTSFLTELKTDDYELNFPSADYLPGPLVNHPKDFTVEILPHSKTGLFLRNGSSYTHHGVNNDPQTGKDEGQTGTVPSNPLTTKIVFPKADEFLFDINDKTNGICHTLDEMKSEYETIEINFLTKNGGLYIQDAYKPYSDGSTLQEINDNDFSAYQPLLISRTIETRNLINNGDTKVIDNLEIYSNTKTIDGRPARVRSVISFWIEEKPFMEGKNAIWIGYEIQHGWSMDFGANEGSISGISTLISGISISFYTNR